ncbi:hypothetical protein [Lysinibacillus piscis]|uniref:SWIM-type domain-containing protein n=1 Tax=Lysinibacillus piscis TaxID=2518931 RepID=A0ABQ5NHU8_9BACI|nr:hypothetical protein [Lysinibacillus sp. KH24]GLC87902.1 hypothetical protein LYSBPC_10290 [Lysinibacillus sp. KH24]
MALSIAQLANEHRQFVLTKLQEAEQALHPSSTEDEELVRRAVFSVRNKSIIFERFNGASSILYAGVQDVRPASVEIDFLQQTLHCSCPQIKWCRHQLGALLALYQHFESVQNWSSAWRAQKSIHLKTLADERTPENWRLMVDEVTKRMLPPGKIVESFSLPAMRIDILERLKRHLPFEREWQPLYMLFMELSIVNTMWKHLNETHGHSWDNYYMRTFVKQSIYAVEDTLAELTNRSRLFATDPFYDAIQVLIREILLERQWLFENRLQLYISLWSSLFYEKPRREQELSIINQFDDPVFEPVKQLFYILLQNEEALRSSLLHITVQQFPVLAQLALLAKTIGETQAQTIILQAILPFIEDFLQNASPSQRADAVKHVQMLMENIELTEAEEVALYHAFGVHGLQPFSSFLLKKGRYHEWVALHQLNPTSLAYLEMCGLKDIVQLAPATALPLYHQYAIAEIAQKSRMNYKQAVRIWKSMRTVAKRAGKMTYFENYMQTISAEFKRLRALQEEIEKGNLL